MKTHTTLSHFKYHGFYQNVINGDFRNKHKKDPKPTFHECLEYAYCDENDTKSRKAYNTLTETIGKFKTYMITVRIQNHPTL